jgi:hypothetical protein
MTFDVWGGAAVLLIVSIVLGEFFCASGMCRRAIAPAVGLAASIVVASIAIVLPGRAVTAAVILLILTVAAAGLLVARRALPGWSATPWVMLAVAAFGAAIPFIANGRTGLMGVGLDNDTAAHLLYADSLRSAAVRHYWAIPPGYPLGPHSLVDALSSGTGLRLDLGFDSLEIATVAVTALVGAAGLGQEAWWRRVVAGTVTAFFYLVSAYYAEASFKEPTLGLFLLAFALLLEELRRRWPQRRAERWTCLIPAAVLLAAAVYVYGYLAVAWFGATAALWLLAEIAVRPRAAWGWRLRRSEVLIPFGVAVALVLVLLAPSAGRLINFFHEVGFSAASTGAITTTNLGNLIGPLSPYEALGIWNSADFRAFPLASFHAGELSALALGVLVLGMVWTSARRQFALPAAVVACALIYLYSHHGQSPYVTAKALVIAGPVVALTGMRGVLGTDIPALPRIVGRLRLIVAAAFTVFALHASYLALRDEPMSNAASASELTTLAARTRGSTVLFLGDSDYATWIFDHSSLSSLGVATVSKGLQVARPSKPPTPGTAYDWDSVTSASLNRFRWVITTSSPFASQVPSAFRLVRSLPQYDLYERVGQVATRSALDPTGAPGAVLDCSTAAGRRLSRRRGVAATMTAPVTVPLGGLAPGADEQATLQLPAGRWTLSLQYLSNVPLQVSVGTQHWRVPAYTDRIGPWFSVGTIESPGGSVPVTIRADKPSALTGPDLAADAVGLAATADPDRRTLRPLRRSCGRYVDWYRLGGTP